MSTWGSVSREDLLSWADADGARELPELVRRLILETCNDVGTIDMPGGTGVAVGGYDGFVQAMRGNPFVPAGTSVWELSVEKNAQAKAEADYAKRTEVPDGSAACDATYVQVMCRVWTKARQWVRDRTADGRWRAVKACNVDNLVTWLEQAPATRLWLLERLGRSPLGVKTARLWWARWSGETEPEIEPGVLLARAGADEFTAALGRPGFTTVAGPIGADELVACAAAAAVMTNGELAARCVVVDSQDSLHRLLAEPNPIVIITTDPALADEVDPATPHTVIVPNPHSDRGDVVLGLIDGEAIANALRASAGERSYELGALARRSLVALRRRISVRPGVRPEWASAHPSKAVRAALLLTSWDESCEADRSAVAAVAGVPYDDAREQLLNLAYGDDPLLARTGGLWHLVSPPDAWLLLCHHLLRDDLEAFVGQASQVFLERDPTLLLPRADRPTASLKGTRSAYSTSLRRGIATGLALLGVNGEVVATSTGRHGERWVESAVRPVLAEANADRSGVLWASVADLLPLLVEAAPQGVLEAIRTGLRGESPVLATIFQDDPQNDWLFSPGSPHTWFLRALETAAWSREHLLAASELLAALAALDPGGRLSNRPAASLETIYCPWQPETAADPEERLAALDRLREHWRGVTWSLLISLLPVAHGIHMSTSAPDYRAWKPRPTGVSKREYWQFVESVLSRLLVDVDANASRWTALLEAHDDLPASLRGRTREALESLDVRELSREDRAQLWSVIRKIVAHHREYADAGWAMATDEVALLEQLGVRLAPEDPTRRHAWLFADDWIELGDLRLRDDYAAYEADVASRRAAAAKEIVERFGLDGVAIFAARARPALVGPALADAYGDDYVDEMLEWLDAGPPKTSVASSYLWRRSRVGGLEWALQTLDEHPGLEPSAQARLLHDTADFPGDWGEAHKRGADVEAAYWGCFAYFGRGAEFPDVLTAAVQLGRVGRWAAALDMLSLYGRKATESAEFAEGVACAFEGFIDAGGVDTEGSAVASWDFARLFAFLDEHVESVGLTRVTRIQWYFFRALGFDPPTTTLHRWLSEDPGFFVEILSLACRRKSGVEAELPSNPDRDHGVAENAWALLHSWSVPPGTDADNGFNVPGFATWLSAALPLLEEADRLEYGKQRIGGVLTYTPAGDASWPTDAVAALFEECDDDDVDAGARLELYNRRGVTSRGVTEGGEQERALAAEYRSRAAQLLYRFPRAARILNDLADEYQGEARTHDDQAERRRRGLEF